MFHLSRVASATVLALAATLLNAQPVATPKATEAKYGSLLWKISGGGAAKPSYLYGTMHVSSKVAFHLSEEFFSAMEQSDLVALEMDPSSWLKELASSEWFSAFSALSDGAKGSADLYHDAFGLRVPDRKSIAQALAQDPEVVDQLLYRMAAGNADHEEDTYLDLFIYQCGRRSGKPVVGLEGMEHSVLQMVKAVAPDGRDPDPARMRRMREAYSNGISPLEAIEDSYRMQDLDRMDSLFDLTSMDDRLRKYVIDERNTVFLDALAPIMARRSVFVGVGAMHLPGPNGLIEMLRAKGFTVEPVRGGVTNKSRSIQRKFEEAYQPVEWATQWPADSTFSIDLPAPMQMLPLGGNTGEVLLAADMVNGSHFMVQRIPTYASVRGVSMEDVMAQVDSALYEGIPGRIVKTTHARTSEGWPSIEVRSVDRVGRVAHHRVVVGPFEIFIFERTMRDVPQAMKDGDRVFGSIRFHARAEAKQDRWSPSFGGMEVALPAQRFVREAEPGKGILPQARVEQLCTVQAKGQGTEDGLLVMSSFFPDLTTIEQDTFELSVLAEQFGKSFSLAAVQVGPVAADARSVRGKGVTVSGDTLHYLVGLDGARYDLLCARGTRAAADRFFGSYRSIPYAGPKELVPYSDTLLHFSVRTASTQQELWEQVAAFGEYFQQIARDARKEKSQHLADERSMLYRSVSSPEVVLVDLERFHRFTTRDDETAFWDDRVEELAQHGRLAVKDRRMTGERETRRVEFLLADSASSRTIRVVMQQCPGAVYTLRSVADAQGRLTAWPDSFFTSFRTDTVFSEGIFVKKGSVLLEWLTGTDSTHAAQARASFGVVRFADTDVPALIDYIRSAEARDKEKGHRKQAIEELGELHHPKVLPFLKQFYAAVGDTVDLQFAVLEAVAAQKTVQGTTLFFDLLADDPPLTEMDWQVAAAFQPFFDSLEVARAAFPRAWPLTRFPEFEGQVIDLAAALVEKGLLPASAYAARRTELMAKAKASLKRAVADAKDQAGRGDDYDEEDGSPTSSTRNFVWNSTIALDKESDILEQHGKTEINAWTPEYQAYQRLLFPFRNEPAVAAYFDQALGSGADAVELSTATYLLAKKAPVPAAFWKRYAERDDARLWTYRTLSAMGHAELFDRTLLTPEKNALAYFVSGEMDFLADSVHVVGTRQGTCRSGSGTLYFFVTNVDKNEGADEWSLSCTGFFDEGAGSPFESRFIRSAENDLAKSDGKDKAIDAMVSDMRYWGRPRWRDASGSRPYIPGMGY